MDDGAIEQIVNEMRRLGEETLAHRAAISEIASLRRNLAEQLRDAIGPTAAAKRLSISRQTFWQILNPTKAQELKRRSARRLHLEDSTIARGDEETT
jgi:predicted DNA-binding protein (UPF0251 family)